MKNTLNILVILVILISFSFLGCSQSESSENNAIINDNNKYINNDNSNNAVNSSSDTSSNTESVTTNNDKIDENKPEGQDLEDWSSEDLNKESHWGIQYVIPNDCIETSANEIPWSINTLSDTNAPLYKIVIMGKDSLIKGGDDATDETVAYNIFYARNLINDNIDYAKSRLYAIMYLQNNILNNAADFSNMEDRIFGDNSFKSFYLSKNPNISVHMIQDNSNLCFIVAVSKDEDRTENFLKSVSFQY